MKFHFPTLGDPLVEKEKKSWDFGQSGSKEKGIVVANKPITVPSCFDIDFFFFREKNF